MKDAGLQVRRWSCVFRLNVGWWVWSAEESGNPRALLFVWLPRVLPACAVSEQQQLSFIYLGFPSLLGGK